MQRLGVRRYRDGIQCQGQFTDSLTWARHWRIVDGRLEMRTERGELLVFASAG